MLNANRSHNTNPQCCKNIKAQVFETTPNHTQASESRAHGMLKLPPGVRTCLQFRKSQDLQLSQDPPSEDSYDSVISISSTDTASILQHPRRVSQSKKSLHVPSTTQVALLPNMFQTWPSPNTVGVFVNRMPNQDMNLTMDLWAEDDLDTHPTQLIQSQEETVQQKDTDQSTADNLPMLPQLHQLVNQITRTVVEELAESLETEFSEKLRLTQLETLQQTADQQDSLVQSLGLHEIRQSLFTLSANLLTLRKAVTRLQERPANDKGKAQAQQEEIPPSLPQVKRKCAQMEQQATASHTPSIPEPPTQKTKVSMGTQSALALVLSANSNPLPNTTTSAARLSPQQPVQ